ncbi:MAG TPA: hypothetical protein VN841_04530 [Bryobacteraceae bacterium]|nr:hypothetical protein [Bryobacteraceae bacterium]
MLGSVVGNADYSNAGIPRGSIFFGSALAPSVQSASGLPLQTILNGVRVRIWRTYPDAAPLAECPILYVSKTQINAILPSSLAAGQYVATVLVGQSESGRMRLSW